MGKRMTVAGHHQAPVREQPLDQQRLHSHAIERPHIEVDATIQNLALDWAYRSRFGKALANVSDETEMLGLIASRGRA